MATSKKRVKPVKKDEQSEREASRAFNPTKSRVGRFIILLLVLGMFMGLVIAAIINAIQTLIS